MTVLKLIIELVDTLTLPWQGSTNGISILLQVLWMSWGSGSHISCCQICIVNSELKSPLMIYFGVQNECFMHAMWYALVYKMYVCMYYVTCLGMQNVCLHVLWNMLWYAKWIMKMYYEICFGVLPWTCQHNCLDILTSLFCLHFNWKWALVLTLLSTKVQKRYPCIYTLVYSSNRSPLLSLVSPRYCSVVGQHKGLSNIHENLPEQFDIKGYAKTLKFFILWQKSLLLQIERVEMSKLGCLLGWPRSNFE